MSRDGGADGPAFAGGDAIDLLRLPSEAGGTASLLTQVQWFNRLRLVVAASVLWLTAARSFAEGRSREMVLIMSDLNASHIHRNEILRMMAARGAMG